RVYRTALPFIMRNKTLRFPVSLVLNTTRVTSNTQLLITCLQDKSDKEKTTYQIIETMIAVISLAGTIFSSPAGMLVTTSTNLVKNIYQSKQLAEKKEYEKSLKSCVTGLKQILSLTLFFHGGLGLAIVLLKVQILLEIYNLRKELNDERDLEAAGHFGMLIIRGQQIYNKLLQFKAQQQTPIFT
ncbi:MAG: hypothetical protein K2X08_06675, partial [Chlamydiales bacterium]|nr:hypothetical protein [Chlamydiales bacterium]